MQNTVTKRFLECLGQLKTSKVVKSYRRFAMSLEQKPQGLSEMVCGKRNVTVELISKAVETYYFNPQYLLVGEGKLILTPADKEAAQESIRVLTIVTNSENDERIVHVPVPAQAGYARESSQPEFIEELPTYTLPDHRYKQGTYRSFDIAGDSMEPTLYEGDKVICEYLDPRQWVTSVKDNMLYVVVTRHDVLVKRLHNKIKSHQEIELHSDNSYYAPRAFHLNDVREVWQVRAKLSHFLPSPQHLRMQLHKEVAELTETIRQQTKIIESLNKTVEILAKGK